MRGIKFFLWFLYKCFAFYSILIYALIFWTPFDGWLSGFMMMSFPIVFFVNLISIPIWFVVDRKYALLPLAITAAGFVFLPRTFGFGKQPEEASSKRTVQILNYNTHAFMLNENRRSPEVKARINAMKDWMADAQADVICMPEFYDEDVSQFRTGQYFNSRGYKYSKTYKKYRHHKPGQYWGLGVFSKYPIVFSRDTVFQEQNGMILTDIKLGKDTIRIITVHLYSMTLNLSKLTHQKKVDGVVKESKFTFRRMRNGFKERGQEVLALKRWGENSPYPVIICGDFNEIPYGYVYGELRDSYANAFEKKGSGFGFTFANLPYFIRIDHQFYDQEKLKLLDFETFRDVRYSDHYPLLGKYEFLD